MTDRVREACEACFDAYQNDCSGFARAVAAKFGITVRGQANDIADTLAQQQESWRRLADGPAAAASAKAGKLVFGALRGDRQAQPSEHGHVVVVVNGTLDRTYPHAYWGRLGGGGQKDKTVNYAWRTGDRDRVIYAEHDLPNALP